jgi:uncharacterized protein with von Willebrand factor type A (vWA) domain
MRAFGQVANESWLSSADTVTLSVDESYRALLDERQQLDRAVDDIGQARRLFRQSTPGVRLPSDVPLDGDPQDVAPFLVELAGLQAQLRQTAVIRPSKKSARAHQPTRRRRHRGRHVIRRALVAFGALLLPILGLASVVAAR